MEKEALEYKKGFNQGYVLSKYNSDLSNKIFKDLKAKNMFEEGLLAGQLEYQKEKELSRNNDLKKIRDNRKGKDLERNI